MSEQAIARMLPRDSSAVRRTATVRPTATVRRREPDGRERGPRAAGPVTLRLVADGGRLVPRACGVGQEPVRTEIAPRRPDPPRHPPRQTPAQVAPQRLARPRVTGEQVRAGRVPVRLTRRGKIAVTAAAVLTIGALSMVLAGVAQATGHSGSSAAPGKGLAKVMVRPGQSLWSLAEAYDPDADTRVVIGEILQMNSLDSTQVQPGQMLWVPRG
jgi:hypothetical protein